MPWEERERETDSKIHKRTHTESGMRLTVREREIQKPSALLIE